MMDHATLKDLTRIPGVGKATAQDLWDMGVRRVAELAGRDPEDLYRQVCVLDGGRSDRCNLYVYRCAVYFAECEVADVAPEAERLKWWKWKDPAPAPRMHRKRTATERNDTP